MACGRWREWPVVARVVARRFPVVLLLVALISGLGASPVFRPGGLASGPLPAALPARAATHPVAISIVAVRGGFDATRTAITLGVTNGLGPFSGWLEVSGADRRVLVAIEVPAGSSRLVTSAYPADNRGTVRVRLLDASEAPVSAWATSTVDYGTGALVVGGGFADPAGFISRSEWLAVDRAAEPPSDPAALDAYAYVIVTQAVGAGPGSPGAESSWAAVRDWVSRGGVLVVTAPAVLPEGVAAGVLEAGFASPRRLDAAAELTVVESTGPWQPGAPALPAGTVISPVESERAPYSVLTGDGTQVLAGAPFGRGVMLFVGVTPSETLDAAAEDSVRYFWESFVLGAARGDVYSGAPWIDPPHVFVTGRVPALWATGSAALVYVVVVGIGLFAVLRRFGRRDAVWWVVPAVVVTTALGVLAAGLASRGAGQEVMARRSVSLGEGAPIERLEVGVYAPFGARFGAAPPAGFGPGALEVYDSGFARPYTLRDASSRGGGVTLEDVRVSPGAGRSVAFQDPGATRSGDEAAADAAQDGPLRWSSTARGDAVLWTVTNVGAETLRRMIVVGNGVFTLPDLPPGASLDFLIEGGVASGQGLAAVTEKPSRPRSRDHLEWEAELRLRAEWAQYGQWGEFGETRAMPAPPGAEVTGVEFDPAEPFPPDFPVRLVAFAEDRGPLPGLDGLSPSVSTTSVVVYEAVLR